MKERKPRRYPSTTSERGDFIANCKEVLVVTKYGNGMVIGPPRQTMTQRYTVAELEDMGFVGVYRPAVKEKKK